MERLQTRRMLDFGQTIRDTFVGGWRHALPIIGCYLLWIATVWIPYINIGTTIAISLLPIELANRRGIRPLSIFAAQYRRDMGRYLIAIGLELLPAMALLLITVYLGYTVFSFYGQINIQWKMAVMTDPAAFLGRTAMVVAGLLMLLYAAIPLVVLWISWSLTFYYICDRQLNPIEALKASARATYGSKWMIVLSSWLLGLALTCGLYIILGLTTLIHNLTVAIMVFLVLFGALSAAFTTAYRASVWLQLKDNADRAACVEDNMEADIEIE